MDEPLTLSRTLRRAAAGRVLLALVAVSTVLQLLTGTLTLTVATFLLSLPLAYLWIAGLRLRAVFETRRPPAEARTR